MEKIIAMIIIPMDTSLKAKIIVCGKRLEYVIKTRKVIEEKDIR